MRRQDRKCCVTGCSPRAYLSVRYTGGTPRHNPREQDSHSEACYLNQLAILKTGNEMENKQAKRAQAAVQEH